MNFHTCDPRKSGDIPTPFEKWAAGMAGRIAPSVIFEVGIFALTWIDSNGSPKGKALKSNDRARILGRLLLHPLLSRGGSVEQLQESQLDHLDQEDHQDQVSHQLCQQSFERLEKDRCIKLPSKSFANSPFRPLLRLPVDHATDLPSSRRSSMSVDSPTDGQLLAEPLRCSTNLVAIGAVAA